MQSLLSHLECSECGEQFAADTLWNLCPKCGKPLLARYNLKPGAVTRDDVAARAGRMWRWRELLPVRDEKHIVNLGEGGTPLLHAPRLGESLGLSALYVKDEGGNPTGTFKARGLAVAVSRAVELGAEEFVMPSAGNAGGALAAYAARAGKAAHIFMPCDAPPVNVAECEVMGGKVTLVDGLIGDAGRLAAAAAQEHGWFNLSTLREPYRIEGKKTMGFELALEFGWELPDVIIYPTGGGTGLIGMWKAFAEMERLGWLGARRPRMVCAQASQCAPLVRAFRTGAERAVPWEDAQTIVPGLRVPSTIGDRLILRALRESGGTAVAVDDLDIMMAQRRLAALEGVFAAPEGAATLAALDQLVVGGWVKPDERVVLFNTGTGLKYTHMLRDDERSIPS
jgi:threonine synthase